MAVVVKSQANFSEHAQAAKCCAVEPNAIPVSSMIQAKSKSKSEPALAILPVSLAFHMLMLCKKRKRKKKDIDLMVYQRGTRSPPNTQT